MINSYHPLFQRQGTYPGEQLDFTQMPSCKEYKYLLVYVDTFIGWIEAFPCKTEKATEVTKTLLREIVLRFGPSSYKVTKNCLFLQK